ncbi:hypothetical protein J7E63_13865 [Bacillus sp. ISL-75]|nr:hypothetical protein [Bacillus sp. ISL-75]
MFFNTPTKPLTEKDNIEAVRKLHMQILANKKINPKEKVYPYENAFFEYEMKDGDKVIRQYRINKLLYEDFYKPIYESKKYKQSSNAIFRVKESKVETFQIRPNAPVNKVATISNPEDVKEALSILKADVLAETYEDNIYFQARGSNIEIQMGKNHMVNMEFKPSYKKFNIWLKKKKWLEQAKVTSGDIDHVLVAENNLHNSGGQEKMVEEIEKLPGSLQVTDKEQIQNSLDNASGRPGNYFAVFYYKQGNYNEVLYFDDQHVPDFIKAQIK